MREMQNPSHLPITRKLLKGFSVFTPLCICVTSATCYLSCGRSCAGSSRLVCSAYWDSFFKRVHIFNTFPVDLGRGWDESPQFPCSGGDESILLPCSLQLFASLPGIFLWASFEELQTLPWKASDRIQLQGWYAIRITIAWLCARWLVSLSFLWAWAMFISMRQCSSKERIGCHF